MLASRRLRTLGIAALLSAAGMAAQAAPVIDLGVAAGYSAFIFGDVQAANDVEGRFAVGGKLTANGASVGYRAPNSSNGAPALVVGGNINFSNGRIYSAAPASVADSTAGSGNQPVWDPALKSYGNGYAVYGGSSQGSSGYLQLTHVESVGKYVDFAAAQRQLTALSTDLAKLGATGTSARLWSELALIGSGVDDATEVFNLNLSSAANSPLVLPSMTLSRVDADAWVIINVLNAGEVDLTGGFAGFKDLQESFGRVLFNLPNASKVKVGTWVDGSILAPNADLFGQGHVEGTVIGKSISQAFEIGWEPPVPGKRNQVPEPASLALALAGLAASVMARRRRAR